MGRGLQAFRRTSDQVFFSKDRSAKLQDEALAASYVHTASILGVQAQILCPFQTKLHATKDQ